MVWFEWCFVYVCVYIFFHPSTVCRTTIRQTTSKRLPNDRRVGTGTLSKNILTKCSNFIRKT